MQAHEKHNIRIGSMLSNGKDKIYRVTHFVFSTGITHKHGDPVEDNIVHVDVYEPDNLKERIGHIDFVHLNFVEPVPIKREYLEVLGFRASELNGQVVYRLNNIYFESQRAQNGFYLAKRVNTNESYPVQFVHEVQILAANE